MSKSTTREYYEAILVAFILALFVRTFVFENFKIPSGSMEDNLLIGDHLVVNKFIFGQSHDSILHRLLPYRTPQRGDVVVFKYPEDPTRDFIKRCVAIAGDTVQMEDKVLYVNGERVDEPFVTHKMPLLDMERDCWGPRVVQERSIFCLGDNRDNSHDSRYWGDVPLANLKGRAVLIYWSYEARAGDAEWTGAGKKIRQLGEVFANFFSKTRWERQFRLIR
jgi:signal peptidase I